MIQSSYCPSEGFTGVLPRFNGPILSASKGNSSSRMRTVLQEMKARRAICISSEEIKHGGVIAWQGHTPLLGPPFVNQRHAVHRGIRIGRSLALDVAQGVGA